jgi:60 kDa SS-A/Ro ribonucleoprotein
MLPKMPLTATIRNLGKMTSVGWLKPFAEETSLVIDKITRGEDLRRQRVHPIVILNALMAYKRGAGFRGGLTWEPVRGIIEALNEAFYEAFHNITPTDKRIVIGLDVSSSMGTPISASPFLSCRNAVAAMCMVTARVEKNFEVLAFCDSLCSFPISKSQRIDDVVASMRGMRFGRTDCALPVVWALEKKVDVDAFIIYTDSETWHGRIHPVQALNHYRQKVGHDVKFVVVGMASNGFTIADPRDKDAMDVVGFDTAAPEVISNFVRGSF